MARTLQHPMAGILMLALFALALYSSSFERGSIRLSTIPRGIGNTSSGCELYQSGDDVLRMPSNLVSWAVGIIQREYIEGRKTNPVQEKNMVKMGLAGWAARYGIDGRRLIIVAVLAAICALLLEVGTLIGAPVSTPLDISCYKPIRLCIFFVVSFALLLFASTRDWRSRVARLRCAWSDSNCRRRFLKHAGILVALMALAAGGAWFACDLLGNAYKEPYCFIAATVAAMVYALVLLRRSFGTAPEKAYLVIVLGAGLLVSILAPAHTLISWDDEIHYARSVALSYVIDPEYTAADRAMTKNSSYNDAWWCDALGNVDNGPYRGARLWTIGQELDALNTAESTRVMHGLETVDGVSMVQYYAISYVPAAIGLWLGRLLSLPFCVTFVLGRVFNLLCYALITYLGLKRLKSGKMIFIMLALLPTALFLGATYSYDFWLNAFLMYGIAWFVGELQQPDRPLTARSLVGMLVVFLLGFAPKAIYAPLLLILLLMPRAKFQGAGAISRKRYVLAVLAVLFVVLATFLIPYFFLKTGPGTGAPDPRADGGISVSQQIAHVFGNPLGYLATLFNFFSSYLAPDMTSGYMTRLCFLGVSNCAGPMVLFMFGVALTDRRPCDTGFARLRFWLWTFVWVAACMVLVATVLYLTFTPVGLGTIFGVQPRYLLTVLLPFLLLCCNFPIENKIRPAVYNATVFALSSFFLFYTLCDVLLLRFW